MPERSRPGAGLSRTAKTTIALLATLTLAAACGSNDSSGSNPAPSGSKNPSLAAQLPDSVKSSGVINAAIDPHFAVNNYYDSDGKTVIGLSPDLLAAVGQVLGVKINTSTVKLASIIPGLQAGRYDMAGMVLTDSTEREQQIDLVNFQQAGQEFLVPKGNPSKIATLADTCGHKIAVAEGGTPVTLLQKQSAACTASGQPEVTVQQFPDVNQAILAVQNNRSDATITNFTKSAYEVEHSNGTLELSGDPFAATLAGWGLPKNSPLTKPISDAINALIADGTYAKIFAKYQLTKAQLPKVVINGAGAGS
jgi:polar amino acid transport system substrate-binding protein